MKAVILIVAIPMILGAYLLSVRPNVSDSQIGHCLSQDDYNSCIATEATKNSLK